MSPVPSSSIAVSSSSPPLTALPVATHGRSHRISARGALI
jgi:hypothetical protein